MKSQKGHRYSKRNSSTKSASRTNTHTTRNFRYRNVLWRRDRGKHRGKRKVNGQMKKGDKAEPLKMAYCGFRYSLMTVVWASGLCNSLICL